MAQTGRFLPTDRLVQLPKFRSVLIGLETAQLDVRILPPTEAATAPCRGTDSHMAKPSSLQAVNQTNGYTCHEPSACHP